MWLYCCSHFSQVSLSAWKHANFDPLRLSAVETLLRYSALSFVCRRGLPPACLSSEKALFSVHTPTIYLCLYTPCINLARNPKTESPESFPTAEAPFIAFGLQKTQRCNVFWRLLRLRLCWVNCSDRTCSIWCTDQLEQMGIKGSLRLSEVIASCQ